MSLLWVVLAAWPFTGDVPDDQIVARADGPRGQITITAERLRRYADSHPDRSPRELAGELLEFELLAAEAAARDFETDAEVRETVAEALVRRYLDLVFEVEWRAETVPEEFARRSYKDNLGHFVYPELRSGVHVLLTTPTEKMKLPKDSPLGPDAKRIAAEIAADLKADPPADNEAFKARCETYLEAAEAVGLRLRVETLRPFPRRGALVEPFAALAFATSEVGSINGPVRTDYGWHVLRIDGVHPPKYEAFEDVQDQIRERILPSVRTFKLRQLENELAGRYEALVNYEPLRKVQERRTHGEDEPAPVPTPTP